MKKESCYDRVEMKSVVNKFEKRKLLWQGWNETVVNIYEKRKLLRQGWNETVVNIYGKRKLLEYFFFKPLND